MPIPSAYGTMRSYDGVRRGGAVPARIIGMIGVTPPASDATLHVIEGGLSPRYLVEFARAHDEAGFDLALVGYSSSSAEGFLIALHAAANTKRLGYLIAHRPGFVAPKRQNSDACRDSTSRFVPSLQPPKARLGIRQTVSSQR